MSEETIYIVYIEDRHRDPQFQAYRDQERAVKAAEQFYRDNVRLDNPNEWNEEYCEGIWPESKLIRTGWLWAANWTVESDFISVQEVSVR